MADYEAAKSWTDRRGYLGSLGNHHYTVEFPWDSGARSNLFQSESIRELWLKDHKEGSDEDLDQMAGKTSLFQLMASEHPLYGKGVLSLLEIPLPIGTPSSVELVNELNRWELTGADLPPLFGSWSIGNRAPTFVTFIPTQLCFPGLLQNLTTWAMVRQFRVWQWLCGPPTTN